MPADRLLAMAETIKGAAPSLVLVGTLVSGCAKQKLKATSDDPCCEVCQKHMLLIDLGNGQASHVMCERQLQPMAISAGTLNAAGSLRTMRHD